MLVDKALDLFGDGGQALFVLGVEHGGCDELADALELVCIEAAGGAGGGAHADAAGHEGRAGLVGDGVLVHGKAHALEQLLCFLAGDVGGGEVDEHQMVVGAAGNQAKAALNHALAHCGAVGDDVLDVGLELGLQRLAEGNGLGGDDVHERAALGAREHRAVDLLGKGLVVGEDEAAARAAKGLVAGGGYHVGIGHRAGVQAHGNQAGDVRHVDHQVGAHLVGDLAHALEVDDAGVCGSAAHDELRLHLEGNALHLVVVDKLGFGVYAVGHDVVVLAREVHRGTMGKVAAVVQGKAQNRVAQVDKGLVGGKVGVCAGMGLHVGELAAEQLAGALDGQVLDDVDLLAAAVVALAGVAFSVLVGEHRAHSLHNRR